MDKNEKFEDLLEKNLILQEKILNQLNEKDKVGYDPRKAASHFSTLSTLIATLTFTVLVLVINPEISNEFIIAGMAFLVPLIGCLISTAVFGVIGGERVLSQRTHVMVFLAAIGFIPSLGYLFFGLGRIFRSTGNLYFETAFFIMLIIFTVVSPLFMTTSLVDQVLQIRKKAHLEELEKEDRRKLLLMDLFTYILVGVGCIVSSFLYIVNSVDPLIELSFEQMSFWIGGHAIATIILIFLANFFALIRSNRDTEKRFIQKKSRNSKENAEGTVCKELITFSRAYIYIFCSAVLASALSCLYSFQLIS